jgi:hypothetical protein
MQKPKAVSFLAPSCYVENRDFPSTTQRQIRQRMEAGCRRFFDLIQPELKATKEKKGR